VICGRDRFGEKPFYYTWGPKGEFIFGSELKAILASGLVNPELDPAMVAFFLKHLYVQPDHTIYRNVFTLSPGHRLVLHNGEAKIDRYWSMPASDQSISLTEAVEGFRRLLTQAVRRQFVADVPVGVFLSGGLDSSTIVAVARDYVQDLNTFSFGFRDNGTNEMHFAGEVARLFRTNHHQLYEGDHEPLSDLLLKMQEVYDEPSADSANVPTYLISRLARQYVKVVLTGEGADELLGGYVAYRPFVYANSLPFPRALKGFFRHAADDLKKRGIDRDSKLYQVIFGGFYKTNFQDLRQAHFLRTKAFNEIEMAALGLPNMPELDFYKPSWPLSGTIEDVLRVDLENFLPGDINVKSDRASMAHGLELRLPFLDMDLASFCLSLPSRFKVDRHTDKMILRRSFENKWPPALRQRPKHGFVAPIKRWLMTDTSVRSLVDAYLNDPNKRLFNLIPFSAVRPMIRANDYRTWALLELSLWLESRPVYN